MNPNDRTTDSLPISRRTVIINTGLATAAIARPQLLHQLCDRSGQPACCHLRRCFRWIERRRRTRERQDNGDTNRKRQDLPRHPDGDHSTQEGPIQGIQRNLYAYGMSGRQHHHHDQLPLPWQQILDHRRLCGESACPTAAASEDDQAQGRHAYRHLKPAPPAPAVLLLRTTALGGRPSVGWKMPRWRSLWPGPHDARSRLFSYQGRMGTVGRTLEGLGRGSRITTAVSDDRRAA